MKAIDLSKQKALDDDSEAIQKINFTRNLNKGQNVNENTARFFIIEESKDTILDFSHRTVKVL